MIDNLRWIKDSDSKFWINTRDAVRKYYYIKVKLFGLKSDYSMSDDIEIPKEDDINWVMTYIKDEYPEYITGIDFSSDLLDGFHPLSKNIFAFMRTHLEALKDEVPKTKLVKEFVKKTNTYRRMYVEHL